MKIKNIIVTGAVLLVMTVGSIACGPSWEEIASQTRVAEEQKSSQTRVAEEQKSSQATRSAEFQMAQATRSAQATTRSAQATIEAPTRSFLTRTAPTPTPRPPTPTPRPLSSYKFSTGASYNCADLVWDYETVYDAMGRGRMGAQTAAQSIANTINLESMNAGSLSLVQGSEAQRAYQACARGR